VTALDDKLAEQARITAELQRMENDGEVTEEKDGDLRDTLIDRWKVLDEECKPIIARMQEIQAITRTAQNPANLEPPNGDDGTSASKFGSPDLVIRNNHDPYDGNELIRRENQMMMKRSELKERALDAVELEAKRANLTDERAEVITQKVQDYGWTKDNNLARHILLTGSEEYQDAFRDYLADPQGEASRAALSLTLANGGYLLPFVLDPTIILTNASSANPWRRISNVKTTTSNTWNGVNSAGVNAAWLAEGTIVTDNTPTVANIVVTPGKAAAWVFGKEKVAA
jgi:hypothetical protein